MFHSIESLAVVGRIVLVRSSKPAAVAFRSSGKDGDPGSFGYVMSFATSYRLLHWRCFSADKGVPGFVLTCNKLGEVLLATVRFFLQTHTFLIFHDM